MSPNPLPNIADVLEDLGMLSISSSSNRNATHPRRDLRAARVQIESLAVAGRFAQARDLEISQLQILLELHGEEDERTMHSMENLSSFCSKLGRQEEADKLLDHVIALRAKIQGEGHPETLGALASRVAALQMAGQMQEAERLGSDLVLNCTNALGVEDVATLRAMSNLASLYCTKGDYSNAETLSHLVLETRRKVLPPDDMDTITSMVNLAGVYFGQKRWAEAAKLLQSVLTVRRRIYGDTHDLTIKIMGLLEKSYEELERWNDLLSLQQLVLEVTRKKFGEAHFKTVEAKMKLMYTHEALKAWQPALDIIGDIVQLLKSILPAQHPIMKSMQEHMEMLETRASNESIDKRRSLQSVYKSLETAKREIRLVKVKKGPQASPLECELVVASLDDAPPFEALSYVWGPMKENKELNLDGCNMNITDNLWRALVQLRLTAVDRVLWVDALAINQMDMQERSSQVLLMRDIYTKSKCTLLWLGEEMEDSYIAMSFLEKLEISHSYEETILQVLKSGLEQPFFNAIECLYTRREYWTRLWVVQEVICAKEVLVYCGVDSVRYETLKDFGKIFAEALIKIDSAKLRESFKSFESLTYKLILHGPAKIGQPSASGIIERETLLHLLNKHRNAKCTDPRDRVYALLGISLQSNSSRPGLQIDYSRTTAEVYREATQAIIEESGKLNVVCMNHEEITHPESGRYHARHHALPSWAPDWSTIIGSLPLFSIISAAKASGDSKARAVFSSDGSRMTVEGACITKIDYATDVLSVSRTHFGELLRTLLGWRLYVQACLGILPGMPSHERLDPFYRLITLDIPAYSQVLFTHRLWWSSWERTLLEKKSIAEIEFTPLQKAYLQNIYDYCSNRRMVVLNDTFANRGFKAIENIQLGLCPQETKQDDILAVLWGCGFPVVLRRQDDQYVFVGEAFMPCYMNSEAIEQERQGKLVVQKFEIY